MKPLDQELENERQRTLEAILKVAKACEYEEVHTQQVTRLALKLFDDLAKFHHMGAQERFWLQAGALLHDIGWIEGWQAHHKTSLKIILNTPMLTLENRERLLIGSIARYHRKALPTTKHDHFASLDLSQRTIVTQLAAILRVADGLDRSHRSVVRDLTATVSAREIQISCQCDLPAYDEEQAALKKGDLLENTYRRKLVIQWTMV